MEEGEDPGHRPQGESLLPPAKVATLAQRSLACWEGKVSSDIVGPAVRRVSK